MRKHTPGPLYRGIGEWIFCRDQRGMMNRACTSPLFFLSNTRAFLGRSRMYGGGVTARKKGARDGYALYPTTRM